MMSDDSDTDEQQLTQQPVPQVIFQNDDTPTTANPIRSFLSKWGIPELHDIFREHDIDLDALKLLDEKSIVELIPKIGTRLKFLQGWRAEFKQKNAPKQHAGPPPSRSSDADSLTTDIDDLLDMLDPKDDANSSSSLSNLPTSPDDSILSSSSSTSTCVPPLEKKPRLMFDTLQILQKTVTGKDIVARLQKNRLLTKKDRSKMTALLVGHLIDAFGLKPSSFEKESLAESIVVAFPFLRDPEGKGFEAWYVKGAQNRPATGYVEEHLRYVRKTMLKSQNDSEKKHRKHSAKAVPDEEHSADNQPMQSEELDEMIAWMKENEEPEETIKSYMAATADYRKHFMKEDRHTLADFLQAFPRVLDKGMIEQDFRLVHHGDKSENLFLKWEGLCNGIIDYATGMKFAWKEVLGLEFINTAELSTDERKNLAFLLLPFVFGGRGRGKGGGRCPLLDSLKAFVDLQPAIISVEHYLKRISAKDRPQPFILALYSLKRLQPTQVFTIVERHATQHPSISKAVDQAFKAHYVLNLDYQQQVKLVWEFLQIVVYDLPGFVKPAVREVRAYLSSSTKTKQP